MPADASGTHRQNCHDLERQDPSADRGAADSLRGTVRNNEEVVPVNVSTWVLLSGVTVGR
jgi:hypothetical protein